MKALSLFSGIGGIDLACDWAGIETVAFCERESFCQKVLRKNWPGIPIYDDVCTLTKERLEADGIGTIDLIHGGYPCQPYSTAGKREGAGDDRALWPEVRRLIETIRPRWFVGENVAGHITLGLDEVLSDLANIGYTAQPFVIPACAVNAQHRRDRVFIVAHSRGGRLCKPDICGEQQRGTQIVGAGQTMAYPEGKRCREEGEFQRQRSEERVTGCGEVIAYPASEGLSIGRQAEFTESNSETRARVESEFKRYRSGREWWSVEPDVGGKIDGIPSRLDGNNWINEAHKCIISYVDTLVEVDKNAYEKKTRTGQILRTLRSEIRAESVQWPVGRFECIQAEKVLQPYLLQLKKAGFDETWLQLESEEVFERFMRSLRNENEFASTSHRPGQHEQRARQYTDLVQALSRLLAQYSEADKEEYCRTYAEPILNAWAEGWEDGIPRVANGIPQRVDRLKALGNAVVPQQIYPIFAAIKQIDDMVRTA